MDVIVEFWENAETRMVVLQGNGPLHLSREYEAVQRLKFVGCDNVEIHTESDGELLVIVPKETDLDMDSWGVLSVTDTTTAKERV